MILIDKVHQLFWGHDLILLTSSQETLSFLGWKLRMSVICLCLLDVQTETAASGGHVPGDPRQVECTKLQHMCSRLLKFPEGAWTFQLPGAHTGCGGCGAQGTRPGEAFRELSLLCWAVSPCLSVSWIFIRALSQACPFHSYLPISKTSQNPEQMCSFSKSLAAGLVHFHRSFSSHELFGAQMLWSFTFP